MLPLVLPLSSRVLVQTAGLIGVNPEMPAAVAPKALPQKLTKPLDQSRKGIPFGVY